MVLWRITQDLHSDIPGRDEYLAMLLVLCGSAQLVAALPWEMAPSCRSTVSYSLACPVIGVEINVRAATRYRGSSPPVEHGHLDHGQKGKLAFPVASCHAFVVQITVL